MKSVYLSLKAGGTYLFSVSLTPSPKDPSSLTWYVDWHQTNLVVRWSRESYSYDTDQLIDLIEISDQDTGSIVIRERQAQAALTWPKLASLFVGQAPSFRIEGVYDQAFRPVALSEDLRGTVWVKLSKD